MVNRAVYDYHVLARLNHKILVSRDLKNLLQIDCTNLICNNVCRSRLRLGKSDVHSRNVYSLIAIVVKFDEATSKIVLVVGILAARIVNLADKH